MKGFVLFSSGLCDFGCLDSKL